MISFHATPVLEGDPQLDGVHLQWSPAITGYHAANGFSLWRRQAQYRPERRCDFLDATRLEQLHTQRRFDLDFGEILFVAGHDGWSEWSARLLEVLLTQKKVRPPFPNIQCLYHFRFREVSFGVTMQFTLEFRYPYAIYIAMREGKVVAVNTVLKNIRFRIEEPIDELRVYVCSRAKHVQICIDDWKGNSDKGWELIKGHLQLPFSEVNPAVVDIDSGWNMVNSRLLPGEEAGNGDFPQLYNLLEATLSAAKKSRLPDAAMLVAADSSDTTDAGETTPFHFSPWNWLLGLTIKPAWRRGLGFAWRDTVTAGLVPGQVYDYKITAEFPRTAIEERILDFRSIPTHTRVGPGFALRDVFFHTDDSAEIRAFPPNAESGGNIVYQKGLEVQGFLSLSFPQAVQRVVLFCAPDFSVQIVVPMLGSSLVIKERIELDLPVPSTQLLLTGKFALLGIAFPALSSGEDPEKLIRVEQFIFHVKFQNTPRLPAPSSLTAQNLQKPWVPNTRQTPEGLGFRLSWQLPDLSTGPLPLAIWPPDCPAPPPLEVNHFLLEHWNKTQSPASPKWKFYDHEEPDNAEGIVIPYRGTAPAQLSPVVFGADLLAIFPPEKLLLNEYSTLQEFSHVLRSPGRRSQIEPGSKHRYRIWSVDAVGRNSASATESGDVILEKRQVPPQPVGIETILSSHSADGGNQFPDSRPTDSLPKSVYVRVLQASDPYLSSDERVFLGGNDRLTILTWGWGDEEQQLDPWVREFRVYWREKEFGRIKGSFSNPAVAAGANWRIFVQFSETVGLDEFVGKHIFFNKIPFRILHHPAGLSGDMEIAPPATQSTAVPQPGDFEVFRKPNGAEGRPQSWDDRIAVVPINSQHQVYQYVLETGLLLTPPALSCGTAGNYYQVTASGSAVRGWLGVSAADGESYVADQISAAAGFGGRAGNESGVVPAQVQAQYFGLPVFAPPAPLADVPVALLDEVRSDEVLLPLLPAAELPGLSVGTHRLRLERVSADAVLPLIQLTETTILVQNADDPTVSQEWLVATSDADELRQQMAQGSQFVASKFFWALATQGISPMEKLWQAVVPQPIDYHVITTDILPNKAERYIYRVRLADETGRLSIAAAYFPRIFRTPDKSRPPMPSIVQLRFRKYETPALRAVLSLKIQMQAAASGTTNGILVFAASLAGVGNSEAAREELSKSRVAKIPNRPDLPPAARTRLSLPDGRLIEPVFLAKTDAVLEAGSQTSILVWDEVEMDVQYQSLGGVWAVAVSEDNILSPLTAPRFMVVGAADEV